MLELSIGMARIELVQGDITAQDTEAIVNAANGGLLGGGGVDGAIHRAGGPAILAACRLLGGCPTGEARITTAGRLAAKHVIHTVGPIYVDGKQGEPELLASAYRKSLALAAQHGVRSLAFPSISTGAYGFPILAAAPIALREVVSGLRRHSELVLARFVLFRSTDLDVYSRALSEIAASRDGETPI